MFDKVLAYLFPKPSMCLICQKPMDSLSICPSCVRKLDLRIKQLGYCKQCHHFGKNVTSCENCSSWTKEDFKNISLFPYENEVREGLIKLKFHEEPWRGEAYGRLMAKHLTVYPDAIVPIPLHKKRFRERGYNQSELIAKGLAERLGVPLDTKSLIRKEETAYQSGLNHRKRYKNVKGAFMVKYPEHIQGKTILLVDDIITTGATLYEANRVLKQSGAKEVRAITLASGIS